MFNVMIVEDIHETCEWMERLVAEAFPDARPIKCHSISKARKCIKTGFPALALVDLNLPDGSGLSLIPLIRKQSPDTHVVVMTIFDDPDHLFPAIRAGAIGYLLKDQPEALLIGKLRGLIKGDPPLSPAIARKILTHFSDGTSRAGRTEVTLNERDAGSGYRPRLPDEPESAPGLERLIDYRGIPLFPAPATPADPAHVRSRPPA